MYKVSGIFFVHASAKKYDLYHVVFFTGLNTKEASLASIQLQELKTAQLKISNKSLLYFAEKLFFQKSYADQGISSHCMSSQLRIVCTKKPMADI